LVLCLGRPPLSGLRGARGDLLERAESFVYRFRIGEGIEKVGGDEDDVGALLHAVEMLAAHSVAEVESWSRG
jgi:hypothetical protein